MKSHFNNETSDKNRQHVTRLEIERNLVYCARLKQDFQPIAEHQINRTHRPNWLLQWLESVLGAFDSSFFLLTRSNYEQCDTTSTRHLFFCQSQTWPEDEQLSNVSQKNIPGTKCISNGIRFNNTHQRLNSRDRGCVCLWSTVFKIVEKKKKEYCIQTKQGQIDTHLILQLDLSVVHKTMYDAPLIHLQGIRYTSSARP